MPECRNCGSHITDDYVRVFSADDRPGVRVCPNCPDLIREGSEVREARSTRKTGTDPTEYEADHEPPAD